MRRLIVLLAIVLLAQTALAGQDWPQFRGPQGNGHADARDLPLRWSETENVRWKTPIHGRGWSSPVVLDQQVWMGTATADGREMFGVCVDLESGRILHDRKLFEVAEPREIHFTNTYASPTPVIEAGRVYLHFGSYGTACLNTRSGETVWSRNDLPCHHWRGPGSSPILFRNLLIIHYDGYDYQYVVALDKTTGETVWKTDRDIAYDTDNGDFKKAYCTPSVFEIDGQLQLISPTSKAVVAYDPLTGKELWQVRYKGFSTAARPLFGNGLLLINTGFSKAELYAIRPGGTGDLTDTNVVWKLSRGVPSKPSQLLIDGFIYMVHDDGVASCVDATTGETVWQERIGGAYSASPIYGDGRIYFLNHQGTTTVVQPGRKFQSLAVNQLGDDPDDGFRASPAAIDGALILRTRTHLYRIGK